MMATGSAAKLTLAPDDEPSSSALLECLLRTESEVEFQHRDGVGTFYGNTIEAMRLRPGQPTEIRSDVPSHVTSVTATATATITIVRRRGMLQRIFAVRRTFRRRRRALAPRGSEPPPGSEQAGRDEKEPGEHRRVVAALDESEPRTQRRS